MTSSSSIANEWREAPGAELSRVLRAFARATRTEEDANNTYIRSAVRNSGCVLPGPLPATLGHKPGVAGAPAGRVPAAAMRANPLFSVGHGACPVSARHFCASDARVSSVARGDERTMISLDVWCPTLGASPGRHALFRLVPSIRNHVWIMGSGGNWTWRDVWPTTGEEHPISRAKPRARGRMDSQH